MPATENSSSSLTDRLIIVPLERLRPHPANPNVMAPELLAKLEENIRLERDYPPLIVRPHPSDADCFEILDGHQRCIVLMRLGYSFAHCYLWPCDDRTALILVATLNRLEGQDDPRLRAELLQELSKLASLEELVRMLPEDERSLQESLSLSDLDLEALLADLQPSDVDGDGLRSITFALTAEDELVVEAAVTNAMEGLDGKNRRGRALARIAESYLEGSAA